MDLLKRFARSVGFGKPPDENASLQGGRADKSKLVGLSGVLLPLEDWHIRRELQGPLEETLTKPLYLHSPLFANSKTSAFTVGGSCGFASTYSSDVSNLPRPKLASRVSVLQSHWPTKETGKVDQSSATLPGHRLPATRNKAAADDRTSGSQTPVPPSLSASFSADEVCTRSAPLLKHST